MKTKRRNFLKTAGLIVTGIAGKGLFGNDIKANNINSTTNLPDYIRQFERSHIQKYNMSGFAAPKIPVVRAGIIGLGNRGPAHIRTMTKIEGVEIKALCDLVPERAEAAKKSLESTDHNPNIYAGSPDEWKKLCERDDLDLVIVTTPWYMHADMSVYAMEQGKHVASEVPVAGTIEECRKLVETAERTGRHCMMMANTSYNDFPLLTLNMARNGFFGEMVHGECGYIANKIRNNFSKDTYWDMWWLKQYADRKGNIYPVHGFCWLAQMMDINRGDKMNFLVSIESNDFVMGSKAKELAAEDDFYKPFAGKDFRGNINTSVIKTSRGRTMIVQHDPSTPRPHSLIHAIYGTKRCAREFPIPASISSEGGNQWISEEEYNALEHKYTPGIVKKMGELSKKAGGHGGIDFMLMWRLIDCLHNGLPLDMDVYDAASWSSILPLSEWSVNNNSQPIEVPDFTTGAWKTNKRNMDINLEKGGNTEVKL